MNKETLRKIIKVKRSELKYKDKQNKDNIIFSNLKNERLFNSAEIIFIFVSFGDEVDTHKIINYGLSLGKTICVPKVISKEKGMKALKIHNLEHMERSRYGILEPFDDAEEISAEAVDLFLVPGLAFDTKGGRVGYGGGFYDKFLIKARENADKIALGYDFQIIEKVPLETTDILIDGIITERGFIKW